MESRIDRIEKTLETLLVGISELRESQLKTDEQFRRTDEQLRKTDEQLSEQFRRTDEQFRRTDEQLSEQFRRTDEQLRKTDEQLREQFRRTDEQFRRTDEKLDRIGKQLGDLGLVQGEIAEDLFYRNLRELFKAEQDMIFSDVKRNLKKKGAGEYDIVAVNGDAVLVIEVKNKLQKQMIDSFVGKKLPRFMRNFPEFRGRRLYGGMGALVVKDDVSRYAEKAGLFVLTQTSEGGAALANTRRFRAKEFN